MNLDVLQLRRPKIEYVSPPVCEGTFSGSGSTIIVLDPFTRDRITGVIIGDDGNGNLIVSWPDFPGAVCYNVYEQQPDGSLVLIAECVECCDFPLPPDIDGPIVVTPIDDDGEGDPSDPVLPPDGPPGGGCESFIDSMGVNYGTDFFAVATNLGLVAGTTTDNLPGRYFNRVGGAVRTTRASSPIQASQAASDLVNTDGADFFLPGDVGKFLFFTSGGDAREILQVNSPTQVQVDVSDTVALSTFTVRGATIGGTSGSMVIAGNGGHLAGTEATPGGLSQEMVWYDGNTGILRSIAAGFEYLPGRLSVDGFFLYNFNDLSPATFIYNPNTETSTQVGAIEFGYDMNDTLAVVGHITVPGSGFDPGPDGFDDQVARKWQAGVTTDIEPADSITFATESNASGGNIGQLFINNSGLIIGEYFQNQFNVGIPGDSPGIRTRTFYNNGAGSFSIGHFFTGLSSEGEMHPAALSNSGIAVGTGAINAVEHFRGWRWTVAGGLVQLNPLPGHNTGGAEDVNDAGYVVGVSILEGDPTTATACIWFPGETTPVSVFSLLPPGHGWTSLIQADYITNNNEVVGVGVKEGPSAEFFFLKLCLDE